MQFLVCSMVRWLLVAQILSLAASGFPTDFPANGGVSIPLVPHIKRSIPEQGQILSSNDSWTSKWHALPFIQSKSLKTFHRFHPESWQAFPENNDDWVVDWQSTLKRTEHKGTVPLITIPQDVGYLARIQIGSQKQPFTGEMCDSGSS